jgi:hypothetical protein
MIPETRCWRRCGGLRGRLSWSLRRLLRPMCHWAYFFSSRTELALPPRCAAVTGGRSERIPPGAFGDSAGLLASVKRTRGGSGASRARMPSLSLIVPLLLLVTASPSAALNEGFGRTPHGGCPYNFQSDMPPGVFCVYRGTALTAEGETCADDVVVIWRTHAPRTERYGEGPPVIVRDIYLGLAADPVLVMRAVAAHDNHANLVTYVYESEMDPQPLTGVTRLELWDGRPPRLTLVLRPPRAFVPEADACPVAFYRGLSIGLIGGFPYGTMRSPAAENQCR